MTCWIAYWKRILTGATIFEYLFNVLTRTPPGKTPILRNNSEVARMYRITDAEQITAPIGPSTCSKFESSIEQAGENHILISGRRISFKPEISVFSIYKFRIIQSEVLPEICAEPCD